MGVQWGPMIIYVAEKIIELDEGLWQKARKP
jgi:hypothetical protein